MLGCRLLSRKGKVKLGKVKALESSLLEFKSEIKNEGNLDFELLTTKLNKIDSIVRSFSEDELIEHKNIVEKALADMTELSNFLVNNRDAVKIELGKFMRNNNKLKAYNIPK